MWSEGNTGLLQYVNYRCKHLLSSRIRVVSLVSTILGKEEHMDITYEQTFNGYPINTDREKGMGCYTKGLAILQDKLESMIENHSKVLVTRVDLRYPQDGSVEPVIQGLHPV